MNRYGSVIAAALAAGLAFTPSGMSHAAPVPQVIVSKKKRRALFSGAVLPSYEFGYRRGPGTTMAQQQRAAKKARNVKRHRAACRG
ncbi:MAG TPA: hypothetical protein VL002_00890 [Candidimonas sp.]|nr:hypothetical protein [Candidimonas sp.]